MIITNPHYTSVGMIIVKPNPNIAVAFALQWDIVYRYLVLRKMILRIILRYLFLEKHVTYLLKNILILLYNHVCIPTLCDWQGRRIVGIYHASRAA